MSELKFDLELKPIEVIKKSAPYPVGIEETKEVVTAGLSLANAIIASLEDDRFTLSDALNFIKPVTDLPSAIIDIQYVPGELADLTDEEVDEIIGMVREKLDVDSYKAKRIAEEAIKSLYQLYRLTEAIKN